jgi:hypothetical protein
MSSGFSATRKSLQADEGAIIIIMILSTKTFFCSDLTFQNVTFDKLFPYKQINFQGT